MGVALAPTQRDTLIRLLQTAEAISSVSLDDPDRYHDGITIAADPRRVWVLFGWDEDATYIFGVYTDPSYAQQAAKENPGIVDQYYLAPCWINEFDAESENTICLDG